MNKGFTATLALVCAALLSGCAGLPGSGFMSSAIDKKADGNSQLGGIQVVDVDDAVARRLLAMRSVNKFSDSLGTTLPKTEIIQPGDTVEVSIWEAPPSALFTDGNDSRAIVPSARITTFPEQMVNELGQIMIPFAGQIPVAGKLPKAIEAEITRRLKDMANQPQVLVRRTRNATSTVTVVGEVVTSSRMPLTPRGERLLDAIAAAGGVRQPVNKMTVQVAREGRVHSLPLEAIIRDPAQNIPLQPGDVITALFQPLSFTALGASGRNEEINFEAQGITLAQALARAGGLVDARADARGVFIFRLEDKDALQWPLNPPATTPEGKVPVIYRVDLQNPATFFVAQSFPVNNKDVLYISNASLAEMQKFLNLVGSVLYPLATFRALSN